MSIVADSFNLPKELSSQPDFTHLKNLEARMNRALIGQSDAVKCVAEMIKSVKTGFYDETKPRGVLVFAGPTGVGKTELAKMTAYEMGVPLHRFDMSEFSESHKVSRLLGSPPGYVNSDQGGELINKLKSTPDCVVLFDEIEKAHPDMYKIFLQLFDEGRLTDSMGQVVNATQTIFILTTNLGSNEIYQQMQKKKHDDSGERLKALCIRTFSAELYNRFDKVVIFRKLDRSAMEQIVEKYLNHLKDGFSRKTLDISWDRQVILHLSALNVDENMGARDIHRKIKELILPKLAEIRIEGKILKTSAKVHMRIVGEQLEFTVLDKGKISEAQKEQEGQEVIGPGRSPMTNEAIVLKNGVIYLDLANERTLKQLEGKHVYRLNPHAGDHPYMDDCIKIINVSSIGEIIYEANQNSFLDRGRWRSFLPPKSNDGGWVVVTPTKNGQAFFENICTIIQPIQLQRDALTLVRKIFSKFKDCHLSEKAPFKSLREYCVKNGRMELLADVDALEKIMGPVTIQILSKEPEKNPDNRFRARL